MLFKKGLTELGRLVFWRSFCPPFSSYTKLCREAFKLAALPLRPVVLPLARIVFSCSELDLTGDDDNVGRLISLDDEACIDDDKRRDVTPGFAVLDGEVRRCPSSPVNVDEGACIADEARELRLV